MRILSLADYVEMVGKEQISKSPSASQAAINEPSVAGMPAVFWMTAGL